MLTFARCQALQPETIEVNALMTEITPALEGALGPDIELRFTLTPDPWSCLVDRTKLGMALVSIAENAAEAMGEGGVLTVKTANAEIDPDQAIAMSSGTTDARAGEFVMIGISDTGQGIAPEVLGQIFEPFFTTKEIGAGPGLGLSMVLGFIGQSGGFMTFDSTPGQGSVFNLYLPRAVPEAQAKTDGASDQHRAEVVLVVEDDTEFRALLLDQLQCLGYASRVAHTAGDAIAIVDQGLRVDVVLSDVVMPGGVSGFTLRERLQRDHPRLPVLLMTGYAGPDATLGSAAGPTEAGLGPDAGEVSLSKPFSLSELSKALGEALAAGSGAAGPGAAGVNPDRAS